jgi:hypothetical protein
MTAAAAVQNFPASSSNLLTVEMELVVQSAIAMVIPLPVGLILTVDQVFV